MHGHHVDDLSEDLAKAALVDLGAELAAGKFTSSFMQGYHDTLREMEMTTAVENLLPRLEMLRHWALGMQSALKTRPSNGVKDGTHELSDDDYHSVEHHYSMYIALKVQLFPKRLTWYDWHCYNAFGLLMRQWGSLRLMSQEGTPWAAPRPPSPAPPPPLTLWRMRAGMEAWQKILNDMMRRCNAFAGHHVPDHVLEAGADAVEAHLCAHVAENAKTKEQWVFDEAQVSYKAYHQYALGRQEELIAASRMMDWRTKFCPYWSYYSAGTLLTCRIIGRYRLRRQPERYKALLQEHVDYYAPVRTLAVAALAAAARAAAAWLAAVEGCCLSSLPGFRWRCAPQVRLTSLKLLEKQRLKQIDTKQQDRYHEEMRAYRELVDKPC